MTLPTRDQVLIELWALKPGSKRLTMAAVARSTKLVEFLDADYDRRKALSLQANGTDEALFAEFLQTRGWEVTPPAPAPPVVIQAALLPPIEDAVVEPITPEASTKASSAELPDVSRAAE